MIEKLGFLVRFWELQGRHATLGEPLAPSEQLELLSLMQLVTDGASGVFGKVPAPGHAARMRNALPAQLLGEGRIMAVEIRAVSASAVIVACLHEMAAGERVILRAADAVSGVEYSIPCSVIWVHTGGPTTMALVVDGLPVRNDFTEAPAARRVTWAVSHQPAAISQSRSRSG